MKRAGLSPLLAGVSCVALLSLAPSEARADCTTMGGSGNTPSSGAQVECVDNLDSDGVNAPTSNDVSVRILGPSGGISVTGASGVLLGDGAFISVSGNGNRPISTSGDNSVGVDVGSNAYIFVDGQVTTSGSVSDAIRTGDSSRVVLRKDGLASTGGGMSNAISVGANSSIDLFSDGTTGARVTTGSSNSSAILLRGSDSSLKIRAGSVVTTSSGQSNPILVEGSGAKVVVDGEVRSSSGDSSAVLATGNGLTIAVKSNGFVTAQSSGSDAIRSDGSGARINIRDGGRVAISSGNSSGIVSGTQARVTVNGEVSASSSESQGVSLGSGSRLFVGSTGTISTSSSNSSAVLVQEDASDALVFVRQGGLIDAVGAQAVRDEGSSDTIVVVEGRVNAGGSQPSFDMGSGNDIVRIAGTVDATSADPVVSLGEGDDKLTLTGTLTGPGLLADGGAGQDTLNLTDSSLNTSSNFSSFETTNIIGGGSGSSTSTRMATSSEDAARSARFPGISLPSLVIDDDQSANTINVSEGANVSVARGGRAGTLSVRDGGIASVEDGGRVDTVVVRDGGVVDVRRGGSARTGPDATLEGGRLRFDAGALAQIDGASFANGVDGFGNAVFQRDVVLEISESPFFTASSRDSDLFGFDFDDAILNGDAVSDNSKSVIRSLEAANLTRSDFGMVLPGLSTSDIAGADLTLSDISGETVVQGAARGIRATSIFTDMLRPSGTAGGAMLAPFEPTARRLSIGDTVTASQTILPPATVGPVFGQSVYAQPAVAEPVLVQPAPTRPVVSVRQTVPVVRTAPASLPVTRETGAWVTVFGRTFDVEGGPSSDYDGMTLGGAIGIERAMSIGPMREGRAGIAVGYTRTELDNDFRDGEVDGFHAGIYADGEVLGLQTAAAVSYGYLDVEGGDADTNGHAVNARLDVAYDIGATFGTQIVFGPVVRAEYTYADFDDVDGVGPLDTQLDGGDFSQFVLGAGVRFGADYGFGSSRVDLMYERAFGDDDLSFDGQFAGGPGFTSAALVEDEDRVRLGVGFDYRLGDAAVIGLSYDGTYSGDVVEHGGSLRATFRF